MTAKDQSTENRTGPPLPRINLVYPHEQVVRWIFGNLPGGQASGMRVLDVHCGTGRHAIFFANEGFDVYACDSSAAALRELRAAAVIQGLSVRLHECVARDLSHYANDAFDFVLDFNTARRASEEATGLVFREVHRVLKPGGKFLCLVRSDTDSADGVEKAFGLFTDTCVDRMSDLRESVAEDEWVVSSAKPRGVA